MLMAKYFTQRQADILVEMNSSFSRLSSIFSPPYLVDQTVPWYLGTILVQPPVSVDSLAQSRFAAVYLYQHARNETVAFGVVLFCGLFLVRLGFVAVFLIAKRGV